MAIIYTIMLTDNEVEQTLRNVGTSKNKALSKHRPGDGSFVRSIKASATYPGFSEVELVLDMDPRKDLKKLGILDK